MGSAVGAAVGSVGLAASVGWVEPVADGVTSADAQAEQHKRTHKSSNMVLFFIISSPLGFSAISIAEMPPIRKRNEKHQPFRLVFWFGGVFDTAPVIDVPLIFGVRKLRN